MYDFPLVVVKDAVPIEYQIDKSRREMLSPISNWRAKRKLDLDDIKQIEENKAHTAKMLAACDVAVAQSQKDMHHLRKQYSNSWKRLQKSMILLRNLKLMYQILENFLLRAQMPSDPEIVSEIEMNGINNDIEYKQTILRTFREGIINQNEELKKFTNTDSKI